MLRLLREIWPAALPLLLYAGWMLHRRHRALRRGETQQIRWTEGPWFWTVMASIAVAVVCLFLLGASEGSVKGNYTPSHMENGALVPGRVGQ
jgi:Family of unknown function (DUF6111)